MPTTARGSKNAVRIIKEVTFGTTPATPTMLEVVKNAFDPTYALGLIRSGQIRTHPFVDRLLKGVQRYDIKLDTEMQDDNHDIFLELMMGASFATNSVKATDALTSATIESAYTDLSQFDQFTGTCITKADFSFAASESSPVKAVYSMMAQGGALDAGSTLASVVTPAAANDPFIFADASLTIGGSSRPVTALSFSCDRKFDEQLVLGSRIIRQYIPAEFTLTGSVTIPLEDSLESARLVGFTDAALVARAGDNGGTNWRQFGIPKTKYVSMGRQVQTRGQLLQVINFEAYFDTGTSTVMTITRSA